MRLVLPHRQPGRKKREDWANASLFWKMFWRTKTLRVSQCLSWRTSRTGRIVSRW
ncbi:hypothetical protein D0868_12845 [Hortaea werneckii]|uniref:Uncharacterized protein n=1 Tax=Hortaea werneckii TaxID=91943 RepID=A0A3M6XRL5_HORWE|nr:hypothetical protein D0868_12845 [Hortaea werneckii]